MQPAGVIPPMVTPVTGRNGTVDREVLASFVEFLVDSGVHGLFPCGSTGEFSSLTRSERSTVIETVVSHANSVPVLAGCGGTGVKEVETLIEDAADAGADAAVVVTPYYLGTTQAGIREFYEQIAADARLPIVLYNIPSLTGFQVSVETVTRLAEQPNIIGIKDSSSDITHLFEIINNTSSSFSVMQGSSELAINSLDIGADGLVMGPANVFPAIHAELYDAYRAGDRARSIELLNSVTNPVVSAMKSLSTAAALKYLLRRSGHGVNEPLMPLPVLTESEKQRLDACHDLVTETPDAQDEREAV